MVRRTAAEGSRGRPVLWRLIAVAILATTVCHLLLGRTRLPGLGAALLAVAALLSLRGWAAYMTAGSRSGFGRDALLGVAAGLVLYVLGQFVW